MPRQRQRRVRQLARRDANHDVIVGVFEDMGASWLDLSNVAGALDGVIGTNGIDQRVEIKNPDAMRGEKQATELTDAEDEEFKRWRGRKPVVVLTVDDAINLINQLRRPTHAKMGKAPT